MSESEKPQNELSEFEATLRALLPLPSAVSRDEMMFRAGQASVERSPAAPPPRRWLWPMATAASVLVAAMLGLMIGRNDREVIERIVHVPAPAANGEIETLTQQTTSGPHSGAPAYLSARNRILARGVDALPASNSSSAETPSDDTYLELRDGLLRRDRS